MKLLNAMHTPSSLYILMKVLHKGDLGRFTIALSAMRQTRFPLWFPYHRFPSEIEMNSGDQVQFDARPKCEEGFREFLRNEEVVFIRCHFRCPFEKSDCDNARFVLLVDNESHNIVDSIPIQDWSEESSNCTP